MLHWQLHRFSSTEALAQEAAARFLSHLDQLRSPGRNRTVALAGGRVAKTFLAHAAKTANSQQFDWRDVHFFWGDERCVPPADPESNFLLASETLLEPCRIFADQIHRVRGELTQAEAVAEAEKAIQSAAPRDPDGFPILDFVLLGMGEDGHIASLFPDTPEAVANRNTAYIPVTGPKPPPQRISLTYGALAAARTVWVIASGAGKEAALASALTTENGNPLGRLLRKRTATEIFTDIDGSF